MFEKRNAYVCEDCRYITLTVHIHEGVTPFLLGCRNPTGCKGMAISFSYQMPGILALNSPSGKLYPTHEWYKPEPGQDLTKGEQDHVNNGGVLLRERTDAPPLMSKIKTAT
jgi:hypothetical protein